LINKSNRGGKIMPFGMDEAEIESRVKEELSVRPGHVARFNKYQIELIAKVIASVIVENNIKLKYSLGINMDNDNTWAGKKLDAMASATGPREDVLEGKAIPVGKDLQLLGSLGEELQVFGRLDELVYMSGTDQLKHEFSKPKPLLIRLPDGSLFLLRDESSYNVVRNHVGRWELIG
jgi:hypothetical protein